MAFTIPNHADANSPFQAEPDSVDFDILAAGYSGSGVISGCAVTAQGSPDMTVAVASGVVSVAGVRVSVTGANSTIGTADGTNPRFDMITVNNSGTIATTAGTAASVPELPNIPSNSVVLALIFVPASDTTIATNQITDKRVFISNGGSGVLDNIIWNLGSDGDAAMVLSSAIIAADDELTNVIEGTSDHLATTANSLIISNVTDDGDILFVVSDGGNSKGLLHLDGANGRVVIHGGDLLMSGAQKIYFYDVGGEYMSSDGSTLTITGATALTPTIGSTAWANANHAHDASNTGGTLAIGTVTISANNTTDETVYPIFVDGATGTQGLESDTGLTYNPSTGVLTTTSVTGNLTGNVTGNTSGTALTVTQAAQSAITSVGTLTGLTMSGDLTLTGAAIDVDLIDDNASAISFDSAGKAGILAIVTTDGSEAVTMSGALTVTGDLTVNGTTTTVDTATLSVEDPLIILGSGNDSADSVDIGIYGLYDTSGSQDLYSGLFRDANDSGKWKLFKDLQAAPTTTVNTSGTGYATATLVANLEGNVTGNVTGNTSGTALTVTQAAQSAITSVGTLTGLTVSGSGQMSIVSTSTSAEGILLHANGGGSETIKLHSDQGTGNDSIELLSDVGGISLDVADGKLIKLGGATVFDDEISVSRDGSNHMTVDCTKGNKFTCDMDGTVANLYLTNPGSTVSGNYMVRLVHNGGARTIDHYYHTGTTTKVHFSGGTKPTLTAATDAEDILALYWDGAAFHATMMLDSKAYS